MIYKDFSPRRMRFMKLLSKKYPSRFSVYTKLIKLKSVLNMPKGTEHFISDIHGEYEAFNHIINNSSGVIKEKVRFLFPNMERCESDKLCTLIYYPKRVLETLEKSELLTDDFCFHTVLQLVEIANFFSAKYSRSRLRDAIRDDFAYIIDELMHYKPDKEEISDRYFNEILKAIIDTKAAKFFIIELCDIIKILSVDRLHVLGDIFDRGPNPDKCMDVLSKYHRLDLQWGNHDVLWMGACCGSDICAFNVLLNNLRYNNFKMLENGYGISLRKLTIFSSKYYTDDDNYTAVHKAVIIISLKLMAALVKRNPKYNMEDFLIFDHLDLKAGTVLLKDGHLCHLKFTQLPTVNPDDPYAVTKEEQEVIDDVVSSFCESVRLNEHIKFLFTKGTMYNCFNGNLLYHGCVPLDEDGRFLRINCDGDLLYGKAYLDYCETKIREGYSKRDANHLDFFWYMWTSALSPLSGRRMKIFERLLLKEKDVLDEPRNPYYRYYYNESTCRAILSEFGLDPQDGHIINGHTPILVSSGEKPVRANGKLLVIDGGFCKAYQSRTGIAGYTLIYSSHSLELKAHAPFTTTEDAIQKQSDIDDLEIISVENFKKRRMIYDTDQGKELISQISDLEDLLSLYTNGIIPENLTSELADSI